MLIKIDELSEEAAQCYNEKLTRHTHVRYIPIHTRISQSIMSAAELAAQRVLVFSLEPHFAYPAPSSYL